MKKFTITIELIQEDDMPNPDQWNWTQLLDLSPEETVEIIDIKEQSNG